MNTSTLNLSAYTGNVKTTVRWSALCFWEIVAASGGAGLTTSSMGAGTGEREDPLLVGSPTMMSELGAVTMKPMQPMKPMAPMKPMDFGEPWWPSDLGEPSSAGGQNDMRYAFFPKARRLLIERDGKRTTYDSGAHEITGVSQQSSGSPKFATDGGEIRLDDLKVV